MKYEVKTLEERTYFGMTRTIDMQDFHPSVFSSIWDETIKYKDDVSYNNKESMIGLERYPKNFEQERKFAYSALIPVHTKEGLDPHLTFTLPQGEYILFETTFNGLHNGFIPKVYDYIMKNNIPIQWGLDYEEYPTSFDHQNPNSIMYVGFRYLG